MTLDEYLQQAADLVQADDAVDWTLADLAAQVQEQHGTAGLRALAGVCGYGLRWAQEQARLSKAYEQETRRVFAELRMTLFRVAASTTDPVHWLTQAHDNGWSSRELQRAIRGEKPQSDKVAKLLGQVGKMLDSEDGDALEDGLLELIRRRESA